MGPSRLVRRSRKEGVKKNSKMLKIISWEDWDCTDRTKVEKKGKSDLGDNMVTLISDQKARICSRSSSIAVTYLPIHIS